VAVVSTIGNKQKISIYMGEKQYTKQYKNTEHTKQNNKHKMN